jgi:hypothetical protein
VHNQRACNKNKIFTPQGSDAEKMAASKQNVIKIFVEEG